MREELKAELSHCKTLPTPPAVATQIIELANDPEADMNRIAKVLALDPAITTKVLRIANSPMYGQRRKTENLRQAVVVLGLNATLSLALSFSLIKEWQGDGADSNGLDYALYWRRALLSATVTRVLAEALKVREAEELFLASLIQDIGILALDKVRPQVYEGIGASQVHQQTLLDREVEQAGSDHGAVGGWLLGNWNFPERIRLAVAASHEPERVPTGHEYEVFARCVTVSSLISEVFLSPEGERPFEELAEAAKTYLHMDRERLSELLDEISELIPDAQSVFDTDFKLGSTQILMEEAREALMLRSLKAMQEANELRSTAEDLANRAQELEESNRRDALTGVFNRRHLNEFLKEAFATAVEKGQSLSVAFADLDKFKVVNDTYGHQAGDRVLRTTANILKSSVRSSDVVARFGGEEFVLVLPGTGFSVGRMVCERIVAAFQKTQHDVGAEESITVTISMGIATHGGGCTFRSVDDFLQAADKALYTAKLQGRNRCVCFDASSMRQVSAG